MRFQFDIYNDNGGQIDVEFSDWQDLKAAKARAVRLAKKHGGPVDLAHDDDRKPWNDRYITTACAMFLSAWHSAGLPRSKSWSVNMERLD